MAEDTAFLDELTRDELNDGCVLTIGNFDGVHVGHRSIIQAVVRDARRAGLVSAALTFEPHPVSVFRGVPAEKFRLSPADEREDLLREAGIEVVITAPFDRAFAQLSPSDFVQGLLIDRLRASVVHVGYDFNFGRNRSGTTSVLSDLTAAHGVRTVVHAPVGVLDAPVSSTRVREALREGDMHHVTRLLGRPYRFTGRTEAGAGRGAEMGVPTLNLYPTGRLLPPLAVYACRLRHGSDSYDAVASLGVRPTFDDGDRVSFETYALDDFPVEARGLDIVVELVELIRPEAKFDSVAALRAAIDDDVARARAILRS